MLHLIMKLLLETEVIMEEKKNEQEFYPNYAIL